MSLVQPDIHICASSMSLTFSQLPRGMIHVACKPWWENGHLYIYISIIRAEVNSLSMTSKFYFGPVEILSGLVKFPITSIPIFFYRLWDLGVVGPVVKMLVTMFEGNKNHRENISISMMINYYL